MKREIKFRGLRLTDKKFIYGLPAYLDISPVKTIRHIEYEPGSMDEIIPETLGQFTGLKDKNGKEIYEGDIVKYKVSNQLLDDSKKYVVESVKWKNVGWNLNSTKEYEIVGNVCEGNNL